MRDKTPDNLSYSLLGLSWRLFYRNWYYFLAAFFALWMTHQAGSRLPFLAKDLADKLVGQVDQIELAPFLYVAITIIFFRTFSRFLFFLPARVLQKDLRVELVEKLEQSFPKRYEKFSEGQIFQVISQDMEQLRALFGFAYLQVANVIIALSVLLPKLASYSPELLWALLPMGGAFILFSSATVFTRDHYRKTQDYAGELQNFIAETYKGKKTIKNYQSESNFLNLFQNHSYRELKSFYNAGMIISWSMPLISFGIGLSFLWGAWIIQVENLGPNSLILFSGFIFLFMEPLNFIAWIGIVLSRSLASWERVKKLYKSTLKKTSLEIKLDQLNISDEETQKNIQGNIKISFWDQVIELDLDFTNKKSSFLALVGETGVGKTELLKRLSYVLKSKSISVSYVAQIPYLYNDNIKNNIFLGNSYSNEDLNLAKEMLALFELDLLNSDLDQLLNLEVGEHGKELSGGQIKRLALIRSLFHPSDVIIWDDPFSSVDVILEKQIMAKLLKSKLIKDRKIIMSTHRLSTLRLNEDFIYLSKQKGIVESGSVKNYLDKKTGIYEFFEKQMV